MKPIPMILHCPSCGMQHIDAPETHHLDIELDRAGTDDSYSASWNNPPHRSHLCHSCGAIWRPADVPTVSVASIKTKGKEDRIVPALEKSMHGDPRASGSPEEIAQWLYANGYHVAAYTIRNLLDIRDNRIREQEDKA